jgi:hypothetical protein
MLRRHSPTTRHTYIGSVNFQIGERTSKFPGLAHLEPFVAQLVQCRQPTSTIGISQAEAEKRVNDVIALAILANETPSLSIPRRLSINGMNPTT